jgi:hypothetical protein
VHWIRPAGRHTAFGLGHPENHHCLMGHTTCVFEVTKIREIWAWPNFGRSQSVPIVINWKNNPDLCFGDAGIGRDICYDQEGICTIRLRRGTA